MFLSWYGPRHEQRGDTAIARIDWKHTNKANSGVNLESHKNTSRSKRLDTVDTAHLHPIRRDVTISSVQVWPLVYIRHSNDSKPAIWCVAAVRSSSYIVGVCVCGLTQKKVGKGAHFFTT